MKLWSPRSLDIRRQLAYGAAGNLADRRRGELHYGRFGVEAFDPATLTGVIAHFDASDDATLFVNTGATNPAGEGDPVHVWVDRVAGVQLIAPSGAVRPTRTAVNGLLGVEGNGVDQLLQSGSAAYGVFDAGITAFIVMRSADATSWDIATIAGSTLSTGNARLEMVQVATGSGLGDRRVTTNRATSVAVIGDGTTIPGTAPEGMVFEYHASGVSTGETRIDGVVIDNTKAGPGSLLPDASDGYLSLMRGVFSNYFDGHIFEVVFADENLSSGDRDAIRAHLLDKWADIIGV